MRDKKIIHLVAAARPNFMKIAPLYRALTSLTDHRVLWVHTGQHYDHNMSGAFLVDLGLPEPDIHLGVGSGSHAEQTAGVMVAYEKVLASRPPDMVVVAGDVNSTLACTLTAKKLNIPVAHLEAGLRSHDRTMPEEINRVVTDSLADLLWTPSIDGDENLVREGASPERIVLIGNIMIDCLLMLLPRIHELKAWKTYDLPAGEYGLATIHRPSNVDDPEQLEEIVSVLEDASSRLPFIFPVHPRTGKNLERFGLYQRLAERPGLHLVEPQSYRHFMSLVTGARLVLTDSGGIQEETTWLNIPCLTLRPNTERPVTVTQGTNELVRPGQVIACLDRVLSGKWKQGVQPDRWDGQAALRAVASLNHFFDDPVSLPDRIFNDNILTSTIHQV